MAKSENLGMQTFDAALFKLYEEGRIGFEDALKNADSTNNLRLRIKLHSQRGIPEETNQVETEQGNGRISLSIERDDDEEEMPL